MVHRCLYCGYHRPLLPVEGNVLEAVVPAECSCINRIETEYAEIVEILIPSDQDIQLDPETQLLMNSPSSILEFVMIPDSQILQNLRATTLMNNNGIISHFGTGGNARLLALNGSILTLFNAQFLMLPEEVPSVVSLV